MFHKILVPIDGLPKSIQPLRAAIELALITHGSIVVLSVASPRHYNGQGADALEDGAWVEETNRKFAFALMVDIMNTANAKNVTSETVVVQSATPHTEIINTAMNYQCDVIFMGIYRKHGLLEKIFDQNVTCAVLENSPIPVLVLP